MVRFFDRMLMEAGRIRLIRSHPEWTGWHGFGDWLSQDGKDGLFGQTPKDLIGTAFLAHDARLLAQIARTLGKEAEAKKFTSISRMSPPLSVEDSSRPMDCSPATRRHPTCSRCISIC